MKCFQYSLLLLSLLTVLPIKGYRILCLFPYNGKSHFVMFGAMCKALAERGHQVDMISHFPSETPTANYTDIVNLQGTLKAVAGSFSIDFAKELNCAVTYHIATTYGNELCNLMGHERMQKFIRNPPKDPPYDLILVEYFGSNCYFGFGHLLNVPIAAVVSSLEYAWMDKVIENPLSNSLFPGLLVESVVLSNFWQRLANTVGNIIQVHLFNYYTSVQTDIMRKHLDQNMPEIREIEKNISLVFVNSHHSFYGIRPLTPALIEVAGLHVEMAQSELSPELQKWMDDAKDGVVYFSLGSLIVIETMPKNIILDLYASFAKIAPVKVLMKIGKKDLLPPGLPNNTITMPWIPQVAILRHKNTRAFISHGGAMGSQEAIYHGIPIIGIPLFADQLRNINVFVHKGMGIRLDYTDLCEKSMDDALNAMLRDPSYMKSAEREAMRFKDRPMTARETTIYWTEYIIRNGPRSLRSPAMDMPWWQTDLLDIYGFLIGCTVLVVYFLAIMIKTATRLFLKIFLGKGGKLKKN